MSISASDFKVTVPALLFDPGFQVFDFSPDMRLTKFLVVEESVLDQSPFIDIRFEPLAQAQFWVDTRQLFQLEGSHDCQRPRPVFIFHHAFVCSTLLARCLAQMDAFFSLKEPWILRRLADCRRLKGAGMAVARWHEVFIKYVGLLCRNFRTGRIPVIKATNVANNLLIDVLHCLPGRPILYLYSDLESFLVSNLKKAAETQHKMPGLAQTFLADGDFAQRYPQMRDPSKLSLLQVCSVVWLASLYNFRRAIEGRADLPIATLDAQNFLDDPAGMLELVSRHFGHQPDPPDLRRAVNVSVIGSHAKESARPYDKELREAEMNEIRKRYRRELAEAIAWADAAVAESGVLDFMRARRLAA